MTTVLSAHALDVSDSWIDQLFQKLSKTASKASFANPSQQHYQGSLLSLVAATLLVDFETRTTKETTKGNE